MENPASEGTAEANLPMQPPMLETQSSFQDEGDNKAAYRTEPAGAMRFDNADLLDEEVKA